MSTTRTRTLAFVLAALACLVVPVVVQATPSDTRAARADQVTERATEAPRFTEVVLSLFERLREIIFGGPPSTDSDQMPGSSMDPDGHRPRTR